MSSIDEEIQRAMREGHFDDLPGKGKPLNLDENPHADPSWRLAHHLLKSSGFSLPWIERMNEIDAHIAQARAALKLARQAHAHTHNDPAWQAALDQFRAAVEEINKEIRSYNLEVPSLRFQRRMLNVEQEIEAE